MLVALERDRRVLLGHGAEPEDLGAELGAAFLEYARLCQCIASHSVSVIISKYQQYGTASDGSARLLRSYLSHKRLRELDLARH